MVGAGVRAADDARPGDKLNQFTFKYAAMIHCESVVIINCYNIYLDELMSADYRSEVSTKACIRNAALTFFSRAAKLCDLKVAVYR